MEKLIIYLDPHTRKEIRHEVVDAIPVCGEDFCDRCGDCLACYWEIDCYPGGGDHLWVEYKTENEDEAAE